MTSKLKKFLCLALAFVFVLSFSSTKSMAASEKAPKIKVIVNDISGKKAVVVSGKITYTVTQKDGKYIFSGKSLALTTDFKAKGVKGLKKVKEVYYNDDRTRISADFDFNFRKDGVWYAGYATQVIQVDPVTGEVTVVKSEFFTENDW